MPRKKKESNPVPEKFQKNCVIYARISDPNKQTEISITTQIKECKAFADKFGLRVIAELSDQSTGTNIDRPKFFELQQLAKKQEFRYILVWRYDRFSRSQLDTYAAIGYFGKYGINIIPIKEQESLEPTAQEKLMAGIYIAMAEYYSAELSIKICRNMYEMAKNGMYLGGPTPLGYKVVDKKLEIDPDTAPIVQEAFQMYADGHTMKELCDIFNSRGCKTANGNPFSKNSFRTIFSNERYIGVYSYKATDSDGNEVPIRFEDKVPALVSEELFLRVQAKLRETSKGPGMAKAKIPYLLKDKIFCGYCHKSMKSDSAKDKNGESHRYYNCRKGRSGSQCKRKQIPKEVIEFNVATKTILQAMNPDYVNAMSMAIEKLQKKGSRAGEIKSLNTEVKALEKKINALVEKLALDAAGVEPLSDALRKGFESNINKWIPEKEKKEIELEKMKALHNSRTNISYDLDDWFSEIRTYNIRSFEDRQHIISKYVKQVIVYDDYMEVVLYQPGEICDIQDIETTLTCIKSYVDFQKDNLNLEIPEELQMTDEEMEAAVDTITDSDNDDDPDPDGPGSGGSPGAGSFNGGSSGKKSTRPHNKKGANTSAKSMKEIFSTVALYGSPLHAKLETLLVIYSNGNVGFVAKIDREC